MQRVCGSCGQDPGAGAFCQHCGTRLTGPPDTTSATSPPSSVSDGDPQVPPPQPATAPPPPPVQPAMQPPVMPPPQPTPAAQAPVKRKGRGAGCLIVAFVLLSAVTVGGYFAWRFIDTEVLPGIRGVTEVTDQFAALNVVPGPPGPCYDLDVERGVVTRWVEVPCDGSRDVESFFWAEFRDEPFPGDEYLARAAADTCGEAFALYVGVTVGQSRYSVDWLVPSESTWTAGDREAVCVVVSGTGDPLTGVVKGSAA